MLEVSKKSLPQQNILLVYQALLIPHLHNLKLLNLYITQEDYDDAVALLE